ncbi:MAG: hypothetical protein K0U93_11750 [Gammaproteobacteria bacterium]|nr:hypothetical protein [Gammaproteobacteria bacterium]
MTEPCAWALRSKSGREQVEWTTRSIDGVERERQYRCDIALFGYYQAGQIAAGDVSDSNDYRLALRGLYLSHDSLERLVGWLREWLSVPLAALRSTPLSIDCGMGSVFGQSLVLRLGERDDILSEGHPVATVTFVTGRLRGELVFVVDRSCIAAFSEGIAEAIGCTL